MNHRIYHLVGCLFVLVVIAGCGPAEAPAAAETPPAKSMPSANKEPPPHAPSSPKSPDVAESPARNQPVAQFSPPFPDRSNLFEPPKNAQSNIRRDDAGETVELKGFVNVHQLMVVLAIDGVISPIPEGGEKYGVQVIAIEPPIVVLQRGRNRWTAALE